LVKLCNHWLFSYDFTYDVTTPPPTLTHGADQGEQTQLDCGIVGYTYCATSRAQCVMCFLTVQPSRGFKLFGALAGCKTYLWSINM